MHYWRCRQTLFCDILRISSQNRWISPNLSVRIQMRKSNSTFINLRDEMQTNIEGKCVIGEVDQFYCVHYTHDQTCPKLQKVSLVGQTCPKLLNMAFVDILRILSRNRCISPNLSARIQMRKSDSTFIDLRDQIQTNIKGKCTTGDVDKLYFVIFYVFRLKTDGFPLT